MQRQKEANKELPLLCSNKRKLTYAEEVAFVIQQTKNSEEGEESLEAYLDSMNVFVDAAKVFRNEKNKEREKAKKAFGRKERKTSEESLDLNEVEEEGFEDTLSNAMAADEVKNERKYPVEWLLSVGREIKDPVNQLNDYAVDAPNTLLQEQQQQKKQDVDNQYHMERFELNQRNSSDSWVDAELNDICNTISQHPQSNAPIHHRQSVSKPSTNVYVKSEPIKEYSCTNMHSNTVVTQPVEIEPTEHITSSPTASKLDKATLSTLRLKQTFIYKESKAPLLYLNHDDNSIKEVHMVEEVKNERKYPVEWLLSVDAAKVFSNAKGKDKEKANKEEVNDSVLDYLSNRYRPNVVSINQEIEIETEEQGLDVGLEECRAEFKEELDNICTVTKVGKHYKRSWRNTNDKCLEEKCNPAQDTLSNAATLDILPSFRPCAISSNNHGYNMDNITRGHHAQRGVTHSYFHKPQSEPQHGASVVHNYNKNVDTNINASNSQPPAFQAYETSICKGRNSLLCGGQNAEGRPWSDNSISQQPNQTIVSKNISGGNSLDCVGSELFGTQDYPPNQYHLKDSIEENDDIETELENEEKLLEKATDDIIADAFKVFSTNQEIKIETEKQYVDADPDRYPTEFEEALDNVCAVAKVFDALLKETGYGMMNALFALFALIALCILIDKTHPSKIINTYYEVTEFAVDVAIYNAQNILPTVDDNNRNTQNNDRILLLKDKVPVDLSTNDDYKTQKEITINATSSKPLELDQKVITNLRKRNQSEMELESISLSRQRQYHRTHTLSKVSIVLINHNTVLFDGEVINLGNDYNLIKLNNYEPPNTSKVVFNVSQPYAFDDYMDKLCYNYYKTDDEGHKQILDEINACSQEIEVLEHRRVWIKWHNKDGLKLGNTDNAHKDQNNAMMFEQRKCKSSEGYTLFAKYSPSQRQYRIRVDIALGRNKKSIYQHAKVPLFNDDDNIKNDALKLEELNDDDHPISNDIKFMDEDDEVTINNSNINIDYKITKVPPMTTSWLATSPIKLPININSFETNMNEEIATNVNTSDPKSTINSNPNINPFKINNKYGEQSQDDISAAKSTEQGSDDYTYYFDDWKSNWNNDYDWDDVDGEEEETHHISSVLFCKEQYRGNYLLYRIDSKEDPMNLVLSQHEQYVVDNNQIVTTITQGLIKDLLYLSLIENYSNTHGNQLWSKSSNNFIYNKSSKYRIHLSEQDIAVLTYFALDAAIYNAQNISSTVDDNNSDTPLSHAMPTPTTNTYAYHANAPRLIDIDNDLFECALDEYGESLMIETMNNAVIYRREVTFAALQTSQPHKVESLKTYSMHIPSLKHIIKSKQMTMDEDDGTSSNKLVILDDSAVHYTQDQYIAEDKMMKDMHIVKDVKNIIKHRYLSSPVPSIDGNKLDNSCAGQHHLYPSPSYNGISVGFHTSYSNDISLHGQLNEDHPIIRIPNYNADSIGIVNTKKHASLEESCASNNDDLVRESQVIITKNENPKLSFIICGISKASRYLNNAVLICLKGTSIRKIEDEVLRDEASLEYYTFKGIFNSSLAINGDRTDTIYISSHHSTKWSIYVSIKRKYDHSESDLLRQESNNGNNNDTHHNRFGYPKALNQTLYRYLTSIGYDSTWIETFGKLIKASNYSSNTNNLLTRNGFVTICHLLDKITNNEYNVSSTVLQQLNNLILNAVHNKCLNNTVVPNVKELQEENTKRSIDKSLLIFESNDVFAFTEIKILKGDTETELNKQEFFNFIVDEQSKSMDNLLQLQTLSTPKQLELSFMNIQSTIIIKSRTKPNTLNDKDNDVLSVFLATHDLIKSQALDSKDSNSSLLTLQSSMIQQSQGLVGNLETVPVRIIQIQDQIKDPKRDPIHDPTKDHTKAPIRDITHGQVNDVYDEDKKLAALLQLLGNINYDLVRNGFLQYRKCIELIDSLHIYNYDENVLKHIGRYIYIELPPRVSPSILVNLASNTANYDKLFEANAICNLLIIYDYSDHGVKSSATRALTNFASNSKRHQGRLDEGCLEIMIRILCENNELHKVLGCAEIIQQLFHLTVMHSTDSVITETIRYFVLPLANLANSGQSHPHILLKIEIQMNSLFSLARFESQRYFGLVLSNLVENDNAYDLLATPITLIKLFSAKKDNIRIRISNRFRKGFCSLSFSKEELLFMISAYFSNITISSQVRKELNWNNIIFPMGKMISGSAHRDIKIHAINAWASLRDVVAAVHIMVNDSTDNWPCNLQCIQSPIMDIHSVALRLMSGISLHETAIHKLIDLKCIHLIGPFVSLPPSAFRKYAYICLANYASHKAGKIDLNDVNYAPEIDTANALLSSEKLKMDYLAYYQLETDVINIFNINSQKWKYDESLNKERDKEIKEHLNGPKRDRFAYYAPEIEAANALPEEEEPKMDHLKASIKDAVNLNINIFNYGMKGNIIFATFPSASDNSLFNSGNIKTKVLSYLNNTSSIPLNSASLYYVVLQTKYKCLVSNVKYYGGDTSSDGAGYINASKPSIKISKIRYDEVSWYIYNKTSIEKAFIENYGNKLLIDTSILQMEALKIGNLKLISFCLK